MKKIKKLKENWFSKESYRKGKAGLPFQITQIIKTVNKLIEVSNNIRVKK